MERFRNVDGQDEAELVSRIQNGDEQAEEELFRRYKRGVTIVISRTWNTCPLTADLCQETFRITFQNIREGTIREPEKLPAYIWGVAHNLVIECLRKTASRSPAGMEAAEDLPDPSPDQLDSILQKERARIVRQVLDGLRSERDRQVLYRFYLAEDDKGAICADLGLTGDQFNLVLFRARKQYRRLYEKLVVRAGK
jgi:RNA polymerase sigma-70 factor (ECF subfamily)